MEIVELSKPRCKTERYEGWINVEMAKCGVIDWEEVKPVFPMF
jgi:hypothetical protein